ncbi:MAG: hypothetical protein ACRDT8_11320 [Micromonosporaceae bacterium]
MSDRLQFKQPPRFLTAAVTAFMAAGLAGCSQEEDKYVHCIDENGEVVDDDYCDEDDDYHGGGYWLYVAGKRYLPGSRVPSDHRSSRIDPKDSTARANAGLPSSGRVSGSTIRGGGFGSGGSGSSGGGGYWGGGS